MITVTKKTANGNNVCKDIDESTGNTNLDITADNAIGFTCEFPCGYRTVDGGVTQNIDECALDTVEAVCGDANAVCTNNDGSYDCACKTGFGRSIVCQDIEVPTKCTNLGINADNAIGFSCECQAGFISGWWCTI